MVHTVIRMIIKAFRVTIRKTDIPLKNLLIFSHKLLHNIIGCFDKKRTKSKDSKRTPSTKVQVMNEPRKAYILLKFARGSSLRIFAY